MAILITIANRTSLRYPLSEYHFTVQRIFIQLSSYYCTTISSLFPTISETVLLWYTMTMKDINDIIIQQAAGGLKVNPDEQRKFLQTFEERVIGLCSIDEANSQELANHFKEILGQITQNYKPVFVKISPFIANQRQIFYLKTAQELGCEATIVSEDCATVFGLVIHTDRPSQREEKALLTQFATLLHPTPSKRETKSSFWKKLFG